MGSAYCEREYRLLLSSGRVIQSSRRCKWKQPVYKGSFLLARSAKEVSIVTGADRV
jgi:hypothetical protein